MLVLTRKVGQRLKIGPNVFVEVIGPPGSRVKLGVHAPPEVKILREELADKDPPHELEPRAA